ncbi:MAG: acetylornithine/succinylornithine family transaminase [Candidatus Lokiarchaeota archaeon]|nr:acetylornithine/succinylornithine family transaminase [Candidatus Lokiarchaeota archaeon]MBD3339928.1 acetylornithine/succinylornithine family transaminase [Candidatus Lokiarchaeota archaeon]
MSEKKSDLIELEQYHHSKLFVKKDFVITKGKGALLYDNTGKEYIDCVGGHAVLNIGHSHPKYIENMKKQLEKIVMVPPDYPVEERAKLLEKLAQITPNTLNQTFLCNSGTESIETALKLILAKNREKKKPEVIAFKKDFHGRTLGSLAMTHNMKYRKPFLSWLSPNVNFASFGDIDSVKELVNENTVAIFCELVQGEGGIYPAPDQFPKELRELCDENDLTFVIDEVQTGFGRTGKMFAFEHYGVVPDVLCLAKAIAGGLPMGATIANDDLFNEMNVGEHGTTYGGNPYVCAAANTTIDIIMEENLVENSARQGKRIIKDILEFKNKKAKKIRDVRGLGLMVGIEYRIRVRDMIKKAEESGVMFLNAGLTTIRLLPPLVLNDSQVDKILEVLHDISS